jgi:AraC-like DNA-binding protein
LNLAHAVAHGDFGRACLYALDRGMVPHAHREGHLLFHLGGAPAEIVVDGRAFPIAPGKGVAINPWQPHYCRTFEGNGHALMLVIYIRPNWYLAAGRSALPGLRFGNAGVTVTEHIEKLVQRICFLLYEQRVVDGTFEEYLMELVIAAHDQTWDCAASASHSKWGLARICDFRIRRALRLLDHALGEPIDLASVSRAAGLSRPHFFKLFREQIGVPPTIYVNALRLERAIDRLAGGEENVAEIGLDLGFSTPASFSRFFAANSVVPPSAYRRSVNALSLQS